jgi:hypothetical protein
MSAAGKIKKILSQHGIIPAWNSTGRKFCLTRFACEWPKANIVDNAPDSFALDFGC